MKEFSLILISVLYIFLLLIMVVDRMLKIIITNFSKIIHRFNIMNEELEKLKMLNKKEGIIMDNVERILFEMEEKGRK